MTHGEFDRELAAHGMAVVIPPTQDGAGWGLVDMGNGVKVDRWRGGSTLPEQLAFLKAEKARLTGQAPPAPKAPLLLGKGVWFRL